MKKRRMRREGMILEAHFGARVRILNLASGSDGIVSTPAQEQVWRRRRIGTGILMLWVPGWSDHFFVRHDDDGAVTIYRYDELEYVEAVSGDHL